MNTSEPIVAVYYPPLTLDMCKEGKIDRNDYYPSTVIEVLVQKHGYKHLGWLNAGIYPPALNDWMEQYSNYSGSYTIMVSHSTRLVYCVDMGD